MNYLVTGGAGFIGSNLVDRLVKEGHRAIVIDDFSLGKEENIANHSNNPDNPHFILYRKSICDNLSSIFEKEGIDAVFHLAALPRVQFSIDYPQKTHEVNTNGTFNLLYACKQFGVKRFIYSSSSSVYGDQESLPMTEDMKPDPLSPYALQKLIGEEYCKLFTFLYGMETISLRYFNVYGPRQDHTSGYANLIPKFIFLIEKNRRPTINGDGNQTRDFTYVDDVINANMMAVTAKTRECFGHVFNIGSGKNLSVNDITTNLIDLSNKHLQPIHGSALVEPRNTLAAISRAKKMLDWSPQTSFDVGLSKTYSFFVSQKF